MWRIILAALVLCHGGEKKTFFVSGKPREVASYKGEIRHGWTRVFYENGNKRSETPYRDGLKHGTEKLYFETGVPSLVTQWSAGKKERELAYWESGKKKLEETYAPAYIRRTEYHPTGEKSFEAGYRDGKLEGTSRRFTEDGKPLEEISYRSGREHGWARAYHGNGRVAQKKLYEEGRLVSRVEYDIDGKVTVAEEYNADGTRK